MLKQSCQAIKQSPKVEIQTIFRMSTERYGERDASDTDAESSRSEGGQLLAQTEARAAAAGITYAGVLDSGLIPYAILATASRQPCRAIMVEARGVMG
jgi:hypothetical protein